MKPLISGEAPIANIATQLTFPEHDQNAHISSSISVHYIEKVSKYHQQNSAEALLMLISVYHCSFSELAFNNRQKLDCCY